MKLSTGSCQRGCSCQRGFFYEYESDYNQWLFESIFRVREYEREADAFCELMLFQSQFCFCMIQSNYNGSQNARLRVIRMNSESIEKSLKC